MPSGEKTTAETMHLAMDILEESLKDWARDDKATCIKFLDLAIAKLEQAIFKSAELYALNLDVVRDAPRMLFATRSLLIQRRTFSIIKHKIETAGGL